MLRVPRVCVCVCVCERERERLHCCFPFLDKCHPVIPDLYCVGVQEMVLLKKFDNLEYSVDEYVNNLDQLLSQKVARYPSSGTQ